MASDLASRIKAKLTWRRHSAGPSWTTRSSSASRLTDQDDDAAASSRSSTTSRPHQQHPLTLDGAPSAQPADDAQSGHAEDTEHANPPSGKKLSSASASAAAAPSSDMHPTSSGNRQRQQQASKPPVSLAAPPKEPLQKPRPKSMLAVTGTSSSRAHTSVDGNDPRSLDTTSPPPVSAPAPTTNISIHSPAPTPASAAPITTTSSSSPSSYHPPPTLPILTHPSASTTLQSIHEDAALSPSARPDLAPDERELHRDHEHAPSAAAAAAAAAPDADQLSLLSTGSPSASASASASNANTPGTQQPVYTPLSSSGASRPPAPPRRKSLGSSRPVAASSSAKTLRTPSSGEETPLSLAAATPVSAMPATRKIWVKRPGASHTLVTINEDDLVDDVRDTILRKYANSLGRTFDAPDLNIRIHPHDHKDRLLQPDEHMCRTLDAHFPGGQTVDDAIIIDIPRRTPKASPRVPVPHTTAAIYYTDQEGRPAEHAEGYFPPVGGGGGLPSPHMALAMPSAANGTISHSIAVIGTGHLPPIPSPGGTRPRPHRERSERPRLARTQTTSSTMLANGSGTNLNAHDPAGMPPHVIHPAAMPTSPGAEHGHSHNLNHAHGHMHPQIARVGTPPPRITTPRSTSARPKKSKKAVEFGANAGGANNGIVASVPPISVLIVEDNPINLKLLEAFVKRLKVRWQTAMNGRDAVKKWRTGGFHLVLMDIQLPVMNGLEATREIRRLEMVNSIGVFSSVPSTPKEELTLELQDKDRLDHPELFKGPVIIVALTASSLQSDRHEALAAGCNDFLTKPVNFVWLERKVMEWGCMQALIDFDGWRRWKDFAEEQDEASKRAGLKPKTKKPRSSLSAAA